MYRNFIQGYREAIPSGLPARLADPDLMAAGKPTFLRIGEGNEPRNELLRVIKQYPSKDEVRTKVLGEMFPPNETNPYFSRPDNIAAIRSASEELGIPLERTGLRIATNPFRLEGDVTDVNLLAQITNKAAGNLQRSGKPTVADALIRKAQFFNQPRSYRELAVDGSEGIDSIIAAYEKAEPRVTANSQGNRPILMQADGLDPNIGIPSGSPENIPPMDIEGLRGAYAYKPADELKRPRFIDMGYGIYTRSGNPITQEQKNLLDMGMADLEDRSFILQPQERAMASHLPVEYFFSKDKWAESKGLPIGSMLPNTEQYRPTTRLGLQTLGLNADIGNEIVLPAVDFSGMTLFPEEKVINRTTRPINRLADDLSNRVLSGEVDLRKYEPFKSNRNTYGIRENKTPWREYYSDPFVYEDKGIDNEVNRLMKAVNEAPAQLENALSNQALANRKAMELETAIQSFKRIARGGKKADISMSPEMMIELAEVAPRIREWKSQRRGNEIMAAKAQDRIAELRASQELLGAEYMVQPKKWGEDILSGYRIGSNTIGGIRDSNEVPANDRFSEEVLDKLIVSQDPSLIEGKSTRRVAKPNGWTIKPNAVQMWREALQQEAFDNRRDYDIASAFGFSGNY